ncbi:MAG TPA: AzlC family ABC transporter permease [Acidimicrobiales bacterium]|nr:AzlC family ABC transporter permease [Acidimicrobiales bacterium]
MAPTERGRERGAWAAIAPVVAAVGVFGISYGVLASAAGVPAWETVMMSMLVFAGSAQFAAVSSFAIGSPAGAVVSGVLLNSRYLATGAAAAPVLPGGRWRRFLLAQLVVDESFALGVGAGSPERPDGRMLVTAGAAEWLCWVTGSAIGALLGPVLGDPQRLGLDAAFPALFVALLRPMLDRSDAVKSAVAGLAVAAILRPFVPSGVALAGAAVAGLLAYR